MTTPALQQSAPASGVGKSVRRIIVYGLLFVLVCLAVGGVSDLLARLLDSGRVLVGDDVSGLALTLAFSLIAGPLAALLWWFAWRANAAQAERSAISWGLYLLAMSTVALISAMGSLLQTASSLVDGTWEAASFASGTLWLGVWGWHRWMRRHPAKKPLRLTGAPVAVGYTYGVVVAAAGGISALTALLATAIREPIELTEIGNPWWIAALQGLVWATGGFVIWWWHWKREGGQDARGGLGAVAVVLIAGLGSVGLALGGIATSIFVVLRVFFDLSDGGETIPQILEPLGAASATAAIGAIIWAYYRLPAAGHSMAVANATRLVTSGITLAATATGIGIVVNSILAAVGAPLVETGTRTLMLGGISALVVGGCAWWLTWRPTATVSAARETTTARRIYLIAVFGLSAIVAIITVIVIGYRIFEFTLDPVSGGSLLERVRAAVGLLVATALVAGYHFALWNRDRKSRASEPARKQTIGQLTLVVRSDGERLAQLFAAATGARVTVLLRADVLPPAPASSSPTAPVPAPGPEISAAQVESAVEGVIAVRAIAIVGAAGTIEVIPLRS